MQNIHYLIMIISAPFIFGAFLYLFHICNKQDIEEFWSNPFRYFVLLLFPFIVLLGIFGYSGFVPDFYTTKMNKRKIAEILICTSIGLFFGFYIVKSIYGI